jgi:hypothetical protein
LVLETYSIDTSQTLTAVLVYIKGLKVIDTAPAAASASASASADSKVATVLDTKAKAADSDARAVVTCLAKYLRFEAMESHPDALSLLEQVRDTAKMTRFFEKLRSSGYVLQVGCRFPSSIEDELMPLSRLSCRLSCSSFW